MSRAASLASLALSALSAIALLSVSGCVTLSRPTPRPHEYLLDYDPPTDQRDHVGGVLRVSPLGIAAAYAGSGIVYREAEHGIGAYSYHRWATEPAGMVGDLLARDIAASGVYDAVLRGPSLIRGDYELSGEVEEIGERVSSGCAARVELRLLLRRGGAHGGPAVLFQRSYTEEQPCKSDDTTDLVGALSRAMRNVSARVQNDVDSAIASDRTNATSPPSGE